MSVRVRVVPVATHRLTGWIAGLSGATWAVGLLGFRIGLDDSLGMSRWWLASLALSAWIGGTLLWWNKAPFVARARVEGGVLRAGALALRADHALAVRVARAPRGIGIALSRSGEGAFLEVESESEARHLLGELGVRWPGRGDVALVVPHRGVRIAQRLAGLAGLLSALLYGVFVGGIGAMGMKGVFGFPALILGGLASVLYVFDAVFRSVLRPGARTTHMLGRSAVDAHARLHDRAQVLASEPRSDEPPARIRILDAAGEPPRAWLERIDAMAQGAGGYRGEVPGEAELDAILDDAYAPVAARLAAARLLATRHGRAGDELGRRVDPALEPRLRVVVQQDAEAAARAIEASAPVFEAEPARRL